MCKINLCIKCFAHGFMSCKRFAVIGGNGEYHAALLTMSTRPTLIVDSELSTINAISLFNAPAFFNAAIWYLCLSVNCLCVFIAYPSLVGLKKDETITVDPFYISKNNTATLHLLVESKLTDSWFTSKNLNYVF